MNNQAKKYFYEHVVLRLASGRWIYDGIYSAVYFIRHSKHYNHTERIYSDNKGWTVYLGRVSDDNIRIATIRACQKTERLLRVRRGDIDAGEFLEGLRHRTP